MICKLSLTLFLFLSGISLFLNSCTDEKKIEPLKTDSTVSKPVKPDTLKSDSSLPKLEITEISKDSLRKLKENEYFENIKKQEKLKKVYDKIINEKNIPQEVLFTFLPDTIVGFTQLPPGKGKIQESETSFTIFARRQFIDSQKRTLVFEIFDYGRGNKVMQQHIYDVVPQDLDAPAFAVKLPDAKGFYYWLDQKSYGHIEVMANKRYVLRVRLNGFKKNDKILYDYLNKINIKSLIKTGK